MDIEHLKEFLVMAKTQNYTSASEELYISQSSIFKHVRSLEAELGVTLFERSGKKVVMTEYGKLLVSHAEIILKQLEEFHEEVEKYNESKANIVNIIDEYPNPHMLLDFRKAYPKYSINHIFMATVSDIMASDAEIFILKGDVPELEADFDHIDVSTDSVSVITPLDHPFAAKESVGADDLKNQDIIGLSINTIMDYSIDSILNDYDVAVICRKLGFEPNIVMSTFPGSEAARLVSEGAGISLLMKNTIKRRLGNQVAYVPLSPEMKFNVSIYYRKARPLSKAAKDFIEYAKQWYADHPQD